MALIVYANTGSSDITMEESGAEFTEISAANDYLIFSAGSDVVADGEAIPSQADLNRAATLISESVETIVDKCFLADISSNTIKEIFNAGNQDKQYVFCAAFDAATATEPVLEMWDDEELDSTLIASLGAGTPANSWWRAIATTSSLPGADWVGTTLAGSTNNYFLWLNEENGALTGATNLYWNMKVVIPAGASASLQVPIMVVKYTTN